MEYMYDQNGRPYAFVLNNTIYYYVLNLQGDVVRLVNTSGTTVASYTYNAYGKLLSTATTSVSNSATVAEKNPIRYRGYYYDNDIKLYYCQSRYYDPTLGRFLNPDAFMSTGQGILGSNMFAYCGNNPIIYGDTSGMRMVYTAEVPNGPPPVNYDVPAFSQEDYSLCWAFCQVMIESFYTRRVLSQNDATAAAIALAKRNRKSIFHEWNKGNWPTNLGAGYSVSSINELRGLLKENGPLYAYYSHGIDSRGKMTSHMVVVTGVNVQTNTVYTNNPWHAFQGMQTFDAFTVQVAYSTVDSSGMILDRIYLAE